MSNPKFLSVENPIQTFGDAQVAKRKLLITVLVHGNEVCGINAVNELIEEHFFENIDSSTFLKVVMANPRAYEQKKRFLDVNLNRLFGEKMKNIQNSNQYEYSLVENLDRLISECDEYLDIHSTSAQTSSFALPSCDKGSHKFARQFPVDFCVEYLCDFIEGTTMTSALRHNKIATTVECGQHAEKQTQQNAKMCIESFLNRGVIPINGKQPKVLKCLGRELVKEGFQYCKEVRAFAEVKCGEVIAKDNEKELKCEIKNCFLIMPTAMPFINEEAFFIGQLKEENDD